MNTSEELLALLPRVVSGEVTINDDVLIPEWNEVHSWWVCFGGQFPPLRWDLIAAIRRVARGAEPPF